MPTTAGMKPDLYFSADLVKFDELDDGTLMVYGIPAMPGVLDNDKQIVDPAWLKAALNEWFATGANVREMHQPIAVGKGTDLDFKGDIPYVTAQIVDPLAIKKIKAKVLQAFSIGIKNPITQKVREAKNGLINGGKIVELTICDRPCIPGSDILDFKADIVKVASRISDREVMDWQRGIVIEDRSHTFFDTNDLRTPVRETNKENKVADTDSTKTESRVDAATEAAALQQQMETDAARVASEKGILDEYVTKAEGMAFCSACDSQKQIVGGRERTVKGNRMIVGACDKGHKLTKFVPDAEKQDAPDGEKQDAKDAEAGMEMTDGEKTVDAPVEKAPDTDAEKTDADNAKTDDNDGDDDGKDGENDDDGMKAADTPAPAAAVKAALPQPVAPSEQVVITALKTLLKSAGIDLDKITEETNRARITLISEKSARLAEITSEIAQKSTTTPGGTTTLAGLDIDMLNEARSVQAEIDALMAQMDGPSERTKDEREQGTVDMGAAHQHSVGDRFNLQRSAQPDLTKTATPVAASTESNEDTADRFAKSVAATLEKAVMPLVARLEEVEHQVKPASAPVLVIGERPSAFVGKQAEAEKLAAQDLQKQLLSMSDDERAKFAAQMLANSPGWQLPTV